MEYTDRAERAKVECKYEFRRWAAEIPSFRFKKKWKVRVLPPFGGAIARFTVEYKGKRVSCYLDCYDELGYFGEPYWELYPYQGDVFRCPMTHTKTLMKKVEEELEGKT